MTSGHESKQAANSRKEKKVAGTGGRDRERKERANGDRITEEES